MNLIRWMRNRLNRQTRTPFNDKQPSQVMSDWNEEMLRSFFDKSGDVQIVEHRYANESCPKLVLLYCTGMIDSRQFMEWALPILDHHMNRSDDWQENIAELTATLQMQSIRTDTCLYSCLFSGQLIVFFESLSLMYSVNIPQIPQRTPEESTTEISVKGPRDAFTEELSTNIARDRGSSPPERAKIQGPFKYGRARRSALGDKTNQPLSAARNRPEPEAGRCFTGGSVGSGKSKRSFWPSAVYAPDFDERQHRRNGRRLQRRSNAKRLAEETVKKEIRTTFEKSLALGADVLQLEYALYLDHYRDWKKLSEGNRLTLDKDSLPEIDVKVDLIHSGMLR